MSEEESDIEDQDTGESNDGVISCMDLSGMCSSGSPVEQRKKGSEERDRRSTREERDRKKSTHQERDRRSTHQERDRRSTREERERRQIRETHLRRETFKIIESLLEGRMEEEYLIRCASLLSQSDLDNVHEERSLASLCGYPLCENRLEQLDGKKRKQLFKIDSRNKQIYKMEEFNLFCSVSCYRSSFYLKEQMSSEPLWMRYTDAGGYDELYRKGFQTFKLYQPPRQVEIDHEESGRGMEERRGIEERSQKVKEVTMKESVSFPYIKQEHLEQLRKSINGLTIKEKNISEVIDEQVDHLREKLKEEKVNEKRVSGCKVDGMGTQEDGENENLLFSSTETSSIEESNAKTDKDERIQNQVYERKQNQVYERLKEWMTFDSYIFIFGTSIIDELIQLHRLKIDETNHGSDSGQSGNQEENKEENKDEILRKKKMDEDIRKMCEKLDDEEILDQLISETDQMEAEKRRVESEVKRKHKDETIEDRVKQRKSKDGGAKKVTFNPTVDVSLPDPSTLLPPTSSTLLPPTSPTHILPPTSPTLLPPTSSKSQTRLRKQLFARQLERTLSSQKISPETVSVICPLTRELIDTFKFTSQNVVVPNHDWPELLLYLLKMMDIRAEKNENCSSDIAIWKERSDIAIWKERSDIAIWKERSVINLYQKICPEESSRSEFESNISTLLNHHNCYLAS